MDRTHRNADVMGHTDPTANPELAAALQIAAAGERALYLTGKAGTGKTHFLRTFLADHEHARRTVILAPTGLAAQQVGGRTIHSFFGLEFSPYTPTDDRLKTAAQLRREGKARSGARPFGFHEQMRYRNATLDVMRAMTRLVIDEVSMVRCDTLDAIDRILRLVRKDARPFGGVQVILVGDPLQLPPIAKPADAAILRAFYPAFHFFHAEVIAELGAALARVELTQVYRQREPDYVAALNSIREAHATRDVLRYFNQRVRRSHSAAGPIVYLGATNAAVDAENRRRLAEIPARPRTYTGTVTDQVDLKAVASPLHLRLKVGAQVMITRNGVCPGCVNGTLGTVAELREEEIHVEVAHGCRVVVRECAFENFEYYLDAQTGNIERRVLGAFYQFPLRLAFAITVHKSQGMSFDRVVVDLEGTFASGQAYVALSRCRTLAGLTLRRALSARDVRADAHVRRWVGLGNSRLPQLTHPRHSFLHH